MSEWEVPSGLFEVAGGRTFLVQVFDSGVADFRLLYERFDCIDLAIALSAATYLGSAVLNYSKDMWLTVDDQKEWDGIIEWLDDHVDAYEIRFFPFANNREDPRFPVFWRRKSPETGAKFLLCPHLNNLPDVNTDAIIQVPRVPSPPPPPNRQNQDPTTRDLKTPE